MQAISFIGFSIVMALDSHPKDIASFIYFIVTHCIPPIGALYKIDYENNIP